MTFLSFAPARAQRFAISQYRISNYIITMTITAILCLIGALIAVQPAHALELDHSAASLHDNNMHISPALITDLPNMQDSFDSTHCRALLKRVHYNHATPDYTIQNRRSASQAAALGLVLGIRFALGPKEVRRHKSDRSPHFQIWQTEDLNGAQALAVADYRRCKNREALQAISDFRWKR